MRVLAVTNMYPSLGSPTSGVFVEQQVKGLLSIGVEVRVLLIDRRREGAMTYYRMAPKLQAALQDFCPDLIHVMYGGVMADQVTRRTDLPPVLVTFHGSDLLGENLSGLARKLISHYGVLCSRKAAARARGIIVVARHLLRALGNDIRQDKIRVIPCGIDLARFQPMVPRTCRQRLGWADGSFHVLFASGNNDPVKRPWLAQAAVDLAAQQGIPAEFHYLTRVPYEHVPLWLNASDVLLLTSLHEGSPTIVKEALACGVPVVSVNVGDVAERIEGIPGCHLALPEPEDLARKLRQVWQRGAKVDCGSRLAELSHVAVAHNLKRFYEDILSHPSGQGRSPACCQAGDNQTCGDLLTNHPQIRGRGNLAPIGADQHKGTELRVHGLGLRPIRAVKQRGHVEVGHRNANGAASIGAGADRSRFVVLSRIEPVGVVGA